MAHRGAGDDGAASGVVAFLIAGVLFLASVVAVLVTTRDTAEDSTTDDATETARFGLQASSLAEVLLSSPGYYHEGATLTPSPLDWSNDANYNGASLDSENLDRLGLLDAEAGDRFTMDYQKFQNLRRAGYFANATNGYVDYLEAAHSLGLSDQGLDFHIRAYPTLNSLRELLALDGKDQNLRVAYIGDIDVTVELVSGTDPLAGLTMTPPVCTTDDATNPYAYLITSRVTNGGSTATQFTLVTTVDLGTNKLAQSQNVNGYLVAPLSSVDLSVQVPAVPGRACDDEASVTFDLYDPVHSRLLSKSAYGKAVDGGPSKTACDGDASHPCLGAPGAQDTTPIGLYIDTGKQNYRPAETVTFSYDGVDLAQNDDLRVLVCQGTALCSTSVVATMKHGTSNNPPTITAGANFDAEKNANSRVLTVPGGLSIPGTAVAGFTDGATYAQYTVFLVDCQSDSCTDAEGTTDNLVVSEHILVTASPVGGYTAGLVTGNTLYAAEEGPEEEIAYLEELMGKFCPSWYDGKASPIADPFDWDGRCGSFKEGTTGEPAGHFGDVFPDGKKIMNEDLPNRLLCQQAVCVGGGMGGADALQGEPRYDITNVLVVGSGVDHNAMTSQSAKGTIEAWVHGGGTIVVFGSEEGNVNWLQPLFHSAIRGNGGPISTPDQGHPMLHVPNELDNPGENYDARDSAWRFNGQTAQAQDDPTTAVFTNVIVVDGTANQGDPTLALSNKGSFGAGTIIITAYMPYDLYNDPAVSDQPAGADCPGKTVGDCEGLKFIHNLLMQGYADLYLDYGPPIPENTNVEPALRTAQIYHPQFVDPIELSMIVYVF